MSDSRVLVELLRSGLLSGNAFFLTGAGVSVGSGIPDFQTIDENWEFDISRDEALSVGLLKRNPVLFWKAYKYLYKQWGVNSGPNSFHRFVADVQSVNDSAFVLTQNIDGLHADALADRLGGDVGKERVLELHGNKNRFICARIFCKGEVFLTEEHMLLDELPKCGVCGKMTRPDVVLFGENVFGFKNARTLVSFSNVLVVAGTSLQVSPVNELPLVAENAGVVTVWVNSEPPPPGYNFTHTFVGSLDDFVSEVGEKVLVPVEK